MLFLPNRQRSPRSLLMGGKALLWLLMFVFTLQLVGSARHKHELAKERSDCASCFVLAHLPPEPPTLDVQVSPPAAARVLFHIANDTRYSFVARLNFLIPRGQAPPSSLPA